MVADWFDQPRPSRLSPRGGSPAEVPAPSSRGASAGHVSAIQSGPRYILEPGAERPRREEPATSAGQVCMAVEALTAFQAAQARAEYRERWLIVGVLLAVVGILLVSLAVAA